MKFTILSILLLLLHTTNAASLLRQQRDAPNEIIEEEILPNFEFEYDAEDDAVRESRSIGYSGGPSVDRPIVKIVSERYNPPGTIGENDFDFAFESENGIRQEAVGVTKVIGKETVVTMKGSYSYIGPDGQTYVVDWYADETGYHPSAPHLPKDVPIPYPEIADAVAAQIAFAAEEEANGIFHDENTAVYRTGTTGFDNNNDNYIY